MQEKIQKPVEAGMGAPQQKPKDKAIDIPDVTDLMAELRHEAETMEATAEIDSLMAAQHRIAAQEALTRQVLAKVQEKERRGCWCG